MYLSIGVFGSFFRGGQHLHPAKIQSLPAKISSCQGGIHLFCQAAVPSFSTKLSCQWAEMKDKWLQNRQKWRKNREIWQKPTKSGRNQTKNDRKSCKMRSFTNNLLSSFPFLSCQAHISVLPFSLFCPAKLINFSKAPQASSPPKYAYGCYAVGGPPAQCRS